MSIRTAQELNEFEVTYGKIVMNSKLKALIEENVAINRLANLDNVPINNYIEVISNSNKYAKNAKSDLVAVIKDAENILNTMKAENNILDISKACFYEKIEIVFKIFYCCEKANNILNDKKDENGFTDYFHLQVKDFIKNSYTTFKQIWNIKESYEFSDIIETDSPQTKNVI